MIYSAASVECCPHLARVYRQSKTPQLRLWMFSSNTANSTAHSNMHQNMLGTSLSHSGIPKGFSVL